MTFKRLIVNLVHNSRTTAGIDHPSSLFEVDGYGTLFDSDGNNLGYSVYISRGDLGRWDSEGTGYVTDLLRIVEGDILGIEEDWLTDEEQEALNADQTEAVS